MSPPQPNPTPVESKEFSPDERALLLRVAHESIETALGMHDTEPENSFDSARELLPRHLAQSISQHLSEPRGAFTSLYLRGQLRGCVGYAFPVNPVHVAVAETARAAAFEDNRFRPVTREEASALEIELSILSPPVPIRAEEVEVGHHGLLISMDGRRGLLLPQVPVEHHWDRVTFLEQTCRKAGLPRDAWQTGATIEAFTAEVFGEKQQEGS